MEYTQDKFTNVFSFEYNGINVYDKSQGIAIFDDIIVVLPVISKSTMSSVFNNFEVLVYYKHAEPKYELAEFSYKMPVKLFKDYHCKTQGNYLYHGFYDAAEDYLSSIQKSCVTNIQMPIVSFFKKGKGQDLSDLGYMVVDCVTKYFWFLYKKPMLNAWVQTMTDMDVNTYYNYMVDKKRQEKGSSAWMPTNFFDFVVECIDNDDVSNYFDEDKKIKADEDYTYSYDKNQINTKMFEEFVKNESSKNERLYRSTFKTDKAKAFLNSMPKWKYDKMYKEWLDKRNKDEADRNFYKYILNNPDILIKEGFNPDDFIDKEDEM